VKKAQKGVPASSNIGSLRAAWRDIPPRELEVRILVSWESKERRRSSEGGEGEDWRLLGEKPATRITPPFSAQLAHLP